MMQTLCNDYVLVLNVGMYNITMLPYSEYCIMLMLSVYMYEYYTLRIYIAVVFPYRWGRALQPSQPEASPTASATSRGLLAFRRRLPRPSRTS